MTWRWWTPLAPSCPRSTLPALPFWMVALLGRVIRVVGPCLSSLWMLLASPFFLRNLLIVTVHLKHRVVTAKSLLRECVWFCFLFQIGIKLLRNIMLCEYPLAHTFYLMLFGSVDEACLNQLHWLQRRDYSSFISWSSSEISRFSLLNWGW